MDICRSVCHSFTFVNMRFVVKVTFFPIKFYKEIGFIEKFLQKFISFFTLICFLGWINSFFYRKQFSPSFNHGDILYLHGLIKQESYRSPHCIFQSVYALNTRSLKILRKSAVEALITLFFFFYCLSHFEDTHIIINVIS